MTVTEIYCISLKLLRKKVLENIVQEAKLALYSLLTEDLKDVSKHIVNLMKTTHLCVCMWNSRWRALFLAWGIVMIILQSGCSKGRQCNGARAPGEEEREGAQTQRERQVKLGERVCLKTNLAHGFNGSCQHHPGFSCYLTVLHIRASEPIAKHWLTVIKRPWKQGRHTAQSEIDLYLMHQRESHRMLARSFNRH